MPPESRIFEKGDLPPYTPGKGLALCKPKNDQKKPSFQPSQVSMNVDPTSVGVFEYSDYSPA